MVSVRGDSDFLSSSVFLLAVGLNGGRGVGGVASQHVIQVCWADAYSGTANRAAPHAEMVTVGGPALAVRRVSMVNGRRQCPGFLITKRGYILGNLCMALGGGLPHGLPLRILHRRKSRSCSMIEPAGPAQHEPLLPQLNWAEGIGLFSESSPLDHTIFDFKNFHA
jgi:hypothetical protein